ncbi:MAG: carboxypeptidase-like regulatory domain-containing protein [Bacteroidales bacterium]|nr:carboxypeptidase-like regulatory domain-containing protein [Bacteroidales bacterium]
MRIVILLLIIFLSNALTAQDHRVSGRVFGMDGRDPLPFVNIVINNSNRGGTTDMDGRFSLASSQSIDSLTFSYVGYEKQTVFPKPHDSNIKVLMRETEVLLPEYVVFPEENPAHRIISNAIANRDVNNPQKMEAFSYISYDKMIFTLEPDSLPDLDSIASDTTGGLKKFLEDQHFFLMETVSERKFEAPDKNLEKVIANRISGFKDPSFVFLLSQMQKASFYDEIITITDKNYINPISRGSTKKYFFLLQDTLYSGLCDTTFIISFRPGLNTRFDGLKGVVAINTNQWAIQNVTAESARNEGGIGMRFRQMYEWINDRHWFPVQLTTEVILNNIAISDSSMAVSLGGGEAGRSITFGIGKSYIRDINFDPDFKRGDFGHVEVDVDPNANTFDEELWNRYRIDTLDRKERNTYHIIDSIGKEANFDRMAHTFESMVTGKIPWGKLDLDLHRFLTYNDFEGLAPGIGIYTNEKLSRRITTGGYFRYGFKDKTGKYGGEFKVIAWKKPELELGVSASSDVEETGGTHFFTQPGNLLNPEYFREFLIRRMDKTERYTGTLSFRTLDYFKVYAGLSIAHKTATAEYRYVVTSDGLNIYFDRFDLSIASLGFRFAYKEKFIQNTRKKISLGTDYPIVFFKYSRGMKSFLNGDFDFNRYDVQVSKSFNHKYFGKTSLSLWGGYIDADIPSTELYHGRASFRPFTIFAPESFATMRMNEFVSNRHIALFFTHNFRKLLFRGEKFEPEFAVAFNAGIGDLKYRNSHAGMEFNTLEKGYYEAGLLVNNLLNLKIYALGLGVFYRLGPYSFSHAGDNFAGKLTLTFPY